MGVRGLLSHVLRHRDKGTTQKVDLVAEARHHGRGGVTLLVDLVDFVAWFLPQVHRGAKECAPDAVLAALGGEFAHLDEALTTLVFSLQAVGVYLEFFVNTPRGYGLVDATAAGSWESEAKKRGADQLETAKGVRQWCRGEKDKLPARLDELPCLPALWYEQARTSLERCGARVHSLAAEEQAPLLSLSRNSEWGYIWGVVSDSIDWALIRGVRLVPMSCFDVEGALRPLPSLCMQGGWPQVPSLTVHYTTSELLAEQLRLGHPPREEELREASGKGKGKGPVGFGQWPWKWWFDQTLPELAMLLGTDATTPLLQKHKLYAQLGLHMGADPVDSIVRWVRNQVYSNKLRWRDVHLEALSPVLADLANRSEDVALALKCSRAVYAQDAGTLRWASAEVARAGCQPGGGAGRAREVEIPQASSLMLRSAALSGYAVLDVTCEDVTRKGAPLAHELLRDLRRLAYVLVGRAAVVELGLSGEQRSGMQSREVEISSDNLPPVLQGIEHAPLAHRRLFFHKALQHSLYQLEGAAEPPSAGEPGEGGEGKEPAVPALRPVEVVAAEQYLAARDSHAAVEQASQDDFLQSTLRYFAGLNLRPEQPLIRQHEFDSVAAMVALCCDASLPGSVLCGAHEWMQQRLGEVKASLLDLLVANFHESSEVRVPIRAVVLGSWFQGTACQLLDLCRLLWLDHPEGDSPHMFLPEPRELYSGGLLAALYLGGAYDAWELQLPRSNSEWWWTGLLKQMSELRQEVIRAPVFGRWKKGLMDSMLPGMVRWPTHQQVQAEVQKCGAAGDELPIDEHRDKILKHIENYRVTCIQGETGCGKSTRVPVYVMEDYFEKKKAGKLKSEDTFMVLCTQPRRIACISLANRVASCMREKVGESIGYKISGDSNVRPGRTKMVYVTTGYLLQVLVNNPDQIRSYSHLILDEVHERDVDSDLLSLVVKLQMTGYNFKLVIMSATLQGDLFTRYFSDKKIKTIFVGVKRYPVEVVYVEQLLDRYGGRSYGHDLDGRQTSEATRGVQAPFASQAVRAVRDAERAFGSGGREAEGWEEEPAGKPAKGEFDDSDSDSDSGEDADAAAVAVAAAKAAPVKKWKKEVRPSILRGLDVLVYELVLRVATPGEGILVFMPGIGEISELYETLKPMEDPEREQHMTWAPSVSRPDCCFKVFALHSLIPKDEQEGAVFDEPPSGTVHVILASNIAESSLTIPKVRVVIDFGLRRQMVYDKSRHMSCLITSWVSQASAKQRIGRTGRVFEGVAIRLFTKQFFDTCMEEFDPPEMQTAPLEKLYVNVKHLASKLPEYQVTPAERRKRTPKELLQLTAQPPSVSNIESSIEILDQLGALTDCSESAELTVLGYLMMSLPLDAQLCRLVIFGALLGLPCEGVVIAAGCSVQDPFTLPSHLIIKDPREYATSLKRSYETRCYFDHGHCSEPLMLRNMFVHWLGDFRRSIVDRCGQRGGHRSRDPPRTAFLKCAQAMARDFAIVPKRIVHLATSVLDTATRTRKFAPQGSEVLKKLDGLVSLLQGGDGHYSSAADADEKLAKLEDLFSTDHWKLKALLVMAFTPQFLVGGTKVRPEEPIAQPEQWDPKSWKKKQKPQKPAKKEKTKLELLLDEIVEQKLAPDRTVACMLEVPKGRSSMGPWHPRFGADVKATFDMITCGERFTLSLPSMNRALVCFEEGESGVSSLPSVEAMPVARLDPEEGLVKDLPMGAHFIDLYGAGRWKFQVPLVNSERLERERAAKDRAAREAKDRERAANEARERREKERAEKLALAKAEKERAEREAQEAAERERRRREAQESGTEAIAVKECPPEYFAGLHALFWLQGQELASSPSGRLPPAQSAAPGAAGAEGPTLLLDVLLHDRAPAEAAEAALAEAESAEDVADEVEAAGDEEDMGPMITIYKPASPYEVVWEVVDQGSDPVDGAPSKGAKAKPAKKKLAKGRCSWRNPMGFLGSCDISNSSGYDPWPNDVLAVFTTLQGGDSKELSWVDGVTVLGTEGDGLVAFVLMVTFLRPHQELSFEVDLQSGRVQGIKGPGGLEWRSREDQHLLVEDVKYINEVRTTLSEAFYTKAAPVPMPVDDDEGINFSGTRGRRDDEPVPQIAVESGLAEALSKLLQVLREASSRETSIDEVTWSRRFVLRKPTVETIDMHQAPARRPEQGDARFQLLLPLTDLEQVKVAAEQRQHEDDLRKKRDEEEKRRRKAEAERAKAEAKRKQRAEAAAAEAAARLQLQKGKKGSKGATKGGAKGPQASFGQPLQQPQQQPQGKGKQRGQQPQATFSQPRRSAVAASGASAGAAGAMAYAMGNTGWQMTVDPSSNRPYYFNSQTNEVTWTPPAGWSPPRPEQYWGGVDAFSMAQAMGMFQHYGQDPGQSRHQ